MLRLRLLGVDGEERTVGGGEGVLEEADAGYGDGTDDVRGRSGSVTVRSDSIRGQRQANSDWRTGRRRYRSVALQPPRGT